MLRAGFIQFDPAFGQVDANLARIESLAREAPADLLVAPELASTGYNFVSRDELARLAEPIPDGPISERLARLARTLKLHLAVGLAEQAGTTDDPVFYNSAALFSPAGWVGTYRKVHLFEREKLIFESGDLGFPVFSPGGPNGPRVGLMICFDWRFPEAARSLAMAGAEVVAHPSNLLKPYCQSAMITRCLENRVFAITANRTGVEDRGGIRLAFTGGSQVVSPEGEILAAAGPSEEKVLVAAFDPAEARRKSVNAHNDLFLDRKPAQYR